MCIDLLVIERAVGMLNVSVAAAHGNRRQITSQLRHETTRGRSIPHATLVMRALYVSSAAELTNCLLRWQYGQLHDTGVMLTSMIRRSKAILSSMSSILNHLSVQHRLLAHDGRASLTLLDHWHVAVLPLGTHVFTLNVKFENVLRQHR